MSLHNKLQKNRGFTLIELMVATTIFTIVMLMGVGSLVTTSNAAKASQKLRIAVDNVNFAMESMTRELRMGTYYECANSVNLSVKPSDGTDCSNGGVIAFTPQQTNGAPIRIAYKLYSRGNGTSSLQRCETNVTPCPEVVSSDVDIKKLEFYVKGSKLSDKIQPSVEILVQGVVNVGIGTPFVLQSMASQRSAEK